MISSLRAAFFSQVSLIFNHQNRSALQLLNFFKDAASWLKYLLGTRDDIKRKLNQIQERVSIRSETQSVHGCRIAMCALLQS